MINKVFTLSAILASLVFSAVSINAEEYQSRFYTSAESNLVQQRVQEYYRNAGNCYNPIIQGYQSKLADYSNSQGDKNRLGDLERYVANIEDPNKIYDRNNNFNQISGYFGSAESKSLARATYYDVRENYASSMGGAVKNIRNEVQTIKDSYVKAEQDARVMRGVETAVTVAATILLPGVGGFISAPLMAGLEVGRYAYNETQFNEYGLKGSDSQKFVDNAFTLYNGVTSGVSGVKSSFGDLKNVTGFQRSQVYINMASGYGNIVGAVANVSGISAANPDLGRTIQGVNVLSSGMSYSRSYNNDFKLMRNANNLFAYTVMPAVKIYNTANIVMSADYAVRGNKSWAAENYTASRWISVGGQVVSGVESVGRAKMMRDDLSNIYKGYQWEISGIVRPGTKDQYYGIEDRYKWRESIFKDQGLAGAYIAATNDVYYNTRGTKVAWQYTSDEIFNNSKDLILQPYGPLKGRELLEEIGMNEKRKRR